MLTERHLLLMLCSLLALSGCCEPEQPQAATPENWVYLYARLHESQARETAEDQYLKNLTKSLANYENTIKVEEIRGAENEIEFIGVDFKIAAPESETEALETLLMNTFRLSGAPYATQIFVVTP